MEKQSHCGVWVVYRWSSEDRWMRGRDATKREREVEIALTLRALFRYTN